MRPIYPVMGSVSQKKFVRKEGTLRVDLHGKAPCGRPYPYLTDKMPVLPNYLLFYVVPLHRNSWLFTPCVHILNF